MIIQKIIGKKRWYSRSNKDKTNKQNWTRTPQKIKHLLCELQGLMASTSLSSMLKVFKMWEKMKVFLMLCFTKLFIVTVCPSDKLLCKILCCDFLSCDFSSVTFCLWLFVLWLSVLHSNNSIDHMKIADVPASPS